MGLTRWTSPQPKPDKGSHLIERRTRRKAIETSEDSEKQKVRRRDRVCRWPRCENCRTFKPRLEVAHLVAKGMGGDHGIKSTADQMVLLDFLTHQGKDGIERHGRKIEPLTPAGADGPCNFWLADDRGGWTLVAEETAIGVYRRD
jgi:hypothetical protein